MALLGSSHLIRQHRPPCSARQAKGWQLPFRVTWRHVRCPYSLGGNSGTCTESSQAPGYKWQQSVTLSPLTERSASSHRLWGWQKGQITLLQLMLCCVCAEEAEAGAGGRENEKRRLRSSAGEGFLGLGWHAQAPKAAELWMGAVALEPGTLLIWQQHLTQFRAAANARLAFTVCHTRHVCNPDRNP